MPSTTFTQSTNSLVRVVIVDDSLIVRERLKALLVDDAPYAEVVGEAEEAQAAIRLIQNRLPDVVILDLQLLDGTGFEVLRWLKLAAQQPVVIVLTNLITPEYKAACLADGAQYILDKSFGFERLAIILRDLTITSDPSAEEREGL